MARSGKEHGSEARQQRAAVLLASGLSRREVAREVGVSERALYKWLEAPEFNAQVQAYVDEQIEHARVQLRALAGKAIEVLAEQMEQGDKSGDKIRAATAVLDRLREFSTKHEVDWRQHAATMDDDELIKAIGELKDMPGMRELIRQAIGEEET